MEKIKANLSQYAFYIVLIILSIMMIIYVGKKEGFHEDEMFSYGSSNHEYDNLFHSYGEYDSANTVIKNEILSGNIIENAKYYMTHSNEFMSKMNEIEQTHKPVWRTTQEANYYMTAQGNQFNLVSVYYNQARDVHPPLFYFLVNIVSSFVPTVFSKYIIFFINLCFFIASMYVIKKIMKRLEKDHLSLLIIIGYGLSMGAISTVLFQRMYMMLTFFTLCYLYLTIKLYKNNDQLDKKLKLQFGATILLGFLTQYYFCIFAACVCMIMVFNMIKKKRYKELRSYLILHLLSAVIGIILFPAAIYHIFFSYRGITSVAKLSYVDRILQYIASLWSAFSVNKGGIIISAIFFVLGGFVWLKSKQKTTIALLTIPAILFTIVICVIAPYIELRYIMCVLPIFTINIILGLDWFIKNKKIAKIAISILIAGISLYGIGMQKPLYLYQGYGDYLRIAEENKMLPYVYILDNDFNQIQSMPEFMIYEHSLILNVNKGEVEQIQQENKLKDTDFIVSIKSYLEVEKILKEVLTYSGHEQYVLLNEGKNDTGNIVYKII